MITIVQGKQAGTKTRRAGSRRTRYSITATNAHVLEVPRAHTGLTGQTLETIGLPESEIVSKDSPEPAAARRGF